MRTRGGLTAAVGKLVRAAAFVSAFLLTGGLAGCEFGAVQSVSADVSPAGWRDPVLLVYRNTDTLTRRSLILSLGHGAAAQRTEGRYVLWSASPRGAVTSDTLSIAITPDSGRGNRTCEAQAAPMEVTLAEQGDYRFTVTPLQNTLGVWNAAITLSKESLANSRNPR